MNLRKNTLFTNGVPELLVLKLLSSQELYGYQLTRAIMRETRENLSFGEGCIYPLLRSLKKRRLLTARRQAVEGRLRVYYSLSPKGQDRLREMESEWERVSSGIKLVLDGSR